MPKKTRKTARSPGGEAERRRGIEPIYAEVGARIRQLRDERGLSQESLAVEIGASQNMLARVEVGSRRVTLHKLEAIARALNAPLRSLLPGEESQPDLSPALQESLSRLSWKDQSMLTKLVDRLAARVGKKPSRRS